MFALNFVRMRMNSRKEYLRRKIKMTMTRRKEDIN